MHCFYLVSCWWCQAFSSDCASTCYKERCNSSTANLTHLAEKKVMRPSIGLDDDRVVLNQVSWQRECVVMQTRSQVSNRGRCTTKWLSGPLNDQHHGTSVSFFHLHRDEIRFIRNTTDSLVGIDGFNLLYLIFTSHNYCQSQRIYYYR